MIFVNTNSVFSYSVSSWLIHEYVQQAPILRSGLLATLSDNIYQRRVSILYCDFSPHASSDVFLWSSQWQWHVIFSSAQFLLQDANVQLFFVWSHLTMLEKDWRSWFGSSSYRSLHHSVSCYLSVILIPLRLGSKSHTQNFGLKYDQCIRVSFLHNEKFSYLNKTVGGLG